MPPCHNNNHESQTPAVLGNDFLTVPREPRGSRHQEGWGALVGDTSASGLRYPLAVLGALCLAMSGCHSAPLVETKAVVEARVQGELELAAISDGRADSFDIGFWGDEPIISDGSVVVLTGVLDGRPFRLWFASRKRLGDGVSVTLDRENDAAQLIVGQPPLFVSNRVDLTFAVSKDGKSARVRGTAREPELRGGPAALRFHGEVRLNGQALETSVELGPQKDYQPDILPRPARPSQESAPEGFTVHRSPHPTLLWAGSLAFAGSYLLPVLYAAGRAFQQDTALLLVPFAGPTLYAKQEDTLDAWSLAFPTTLGQVGGLAILGFALAFPRRRWVRDSSFGEGAAPETSSLQVLPWTTPSTHGIQVLGRF